MRKGHHTDDPTSLEPQEDARAKSQSTARREGFPRRNDRGPTVADETKIVVRGHRFPRNALNRVRNFEAMPCTHVLTAGLPDRRPSAGADLLSRS